MGGTFRFTRSNLLRKGLVQEWEMPVPGFCLLFNWHFRSVVTWSAANRSHRDSAVDFLRDWVSNSGP